MTETDPPRERPPPSSPYAALSEAAKGPSRHAEGRATQQANLSQLLAHYTLSPFYAEEAHRLQALKDQMWAAFQSDPTSTPSLHLFEATRTYTVALNSQLQVMAHRRPKQIVRPSQGHDREVPKPKSG